MSTVIAFPRPTLKTLPRRVVPFAPAELRRTAAAITPGAEVLWDRNDLIFAVPGDPDPADPAPTDPVRLADLGIALSGVDRKIRWAARALWACALAGLFIDIGIGIALGAMKGWW